MEITVSNIVWDTSDFTEEEELASGICVPDLPTTVVINTDEMEDVEDIGDWLADNYGFCVESYVVED